jgi:hypothetical protein
MPDEPLIDLIKFCRSCPAPALPLSEIEDEIDEPGLQALHKFIDLCYSCGQRIREEIFNLAHIIFEFTQTDYDLVNPLDR